MVGSLVLVVLIIIFGVFLPTVSYIKTTTDETDRLRTYLEQKYEQSLRYRVTRNKVKEIKASSLDFTSHIFKKGQELALITYMENMAAKYNLNQSIISSNLDKITNNRINIDLNISGDYIKIFKYLSEIEASDYFFNIERLQIAPVYERNGEPTHNTNLYLTLDLYVSP